MNNTGHAPLDPQPLISEEQAESDRAHFMETAAAYKSRSLTTQQLRERVARLVTGGLNCKQAAQRTHISHAYAHRLYTQWKEQQQCNPST